MTLSQDPYLNNKVAVESGSFYLAIPPILPLRKPQEISMGKKPETSVAMSKIIVSEVSPSDIAIEAKMYWNNKRWLNGIKLEDMKGMETRILGVMDIQEDFFRLLGQEHLLEPPVKENIWVTEIRQVEPQEVGFLLARFRALLKIYEARDLERLILNTFILTPQDVRLEGNLDSLSYILTKLGQSKEIIKIRAEIESTESMPKAA